MVDTSSLAGVLRASNQRRRRPMGEPPNQTRTQREKRVPVSPYEGQPTMDQAYNETFEREIEAPVARPVKEAFSDFFLPYSAPAARSGELGLGDVAKDAAGYVAGGVIGRGVTKGLQGAAPMFEEAARRVPKPNPRFVEAIAEFLARPTTAYRGTLNRDVLEQGFNELGERIPAGRELYRLPSAGQVGAYSGSQSVPLPRDVGAQFLPGRAQSVAGSADLQRLGAIMRGLGADTGGAAYRNPGLMKITTQEDIPGLEDLPGFLARNVDDVPRGLPTESTFTNEGLLGPATRYVLRDFMPGSGEVPPTWLFDAFAK